MSYVSAVALGRQLQLLEAFFVSDSGWQTTSCMSPISSSAARTAATAATTAFWLAQGLPTQPRPLVSPPETLSPAASSLVEACGNALDLNGIGMLAIYDWTFDRLLQLRFFSKHTVVALKPAAPSEAETAPIVVALNVPAIERVAGWTWRKVKGMPKLSNAAQVWCNDSAHRNRDYF